MPVKKEGGAFPVASIVPIVTALAPLAVSVAERYWLKKGNGVIKTKSRYNPYGGVMAPRPYVGGKCYGGRCK